MTTRDPAADPALRSWVASANDPACDFPIQNLPFGVFTRRASGEAARVGVAIGDQVIDVALLARAGLLGDSLSRVATACEQPRLNELMRLGRSAVRSLRARLSELMASDDRGGVARREASEILIPMDECEFSVPAEVGDYTDFYASIHHATNVGSLFRPDQPLLPNYKWVPVGYHGRASSIAVSGTDVVRPHGQFTTGADRPMFGPTRRLDYELEVGAFIADGNVRGEPIPTADAERHIFGLCLVNDWSARDIQAWEYQPLGPFLAKSFATTVSPWVVTLDALEPFRIPAFARSNDDPQPLEYLDAPNDRARGGFEITLEVALATQRMRDERIPSCRVSLGNFRDLYWTFGQLVAHQTSNGCNLRTGDLIASGTVSGATRDSRGCLLELTSGGSEPLRLPTGETRAFLEDGDEVTLRGWCDRPGWPRIGFGECVGRVRPAVALRQ